MEDIQTVASIQSTPDKPKTDLRKFMVPLIVVFIMVVVGILYLLWVRSEENAEVYDINSTTEQEENQVAELHEDPEILTSFHTLEIPELTPEDYQLQTLRLKANKEPSGECDECSMAITFKDGVGSWFEVFAKEDTYCEATKDCVLVGYAGTVSGCGDYNFSVNSSKANEIYETPEKYFQVEEIPPPTIACGRAMSNSIGSVCVNNYCETLDESIFSEEYFYGYEGSSDLTKIIY